MLLLIGFGFVFSQLIDHGWGLAADIRLVNLDVAGRDRLSVVLAHLFPDFVSDPPSRLIGHANLALEFFAAHAVARRDKEVDRVEPDLERRAGVLNYRASGRLQMITTGRTGPRAAIAYPVEGAFDTTGLADVVVAEADGEDVLKARLIIGEPHEEIADAEFGAG